MPRLSVRACTRILGIIWIASAVQLLLHTVHKSSYVLEEPKAVPRLPHTEWITGHAVVLRNLHESVTTEEVARAAELLAESRIHAVSVVIDRDLAAFPAVDPAALARRVHGVGLRLVVWITPAIPADSPAFSDLSSQGLLLTKGKLREWDPYIGGAPKKQAALLDLTHPQGKTWFQRNVLQKYLAAGVDGMLCDPADALLIGEHQEQGHRGHVTQEDYSREYYWGVLDYGRDVKGLDFSMMGAAVSRFTHSTQARLLPMDAGIAGWVRYASGAPRSEDDLRATIGAVFHSAQERYIGYGVGPIPIDHLDPLALRSLQLGAVLPQMLTCIALSSVEKFAASPPFAVRWNAAGHAELRPYLQTAIAHAFRAARSAVQPIGTVPAFSPPEDTSFLLGDDLVVCPAIGSRSATSCTLPEGRWVRVDDPWQNRTVVEGKGSAVEVSAPPSMLVPLFLRHGAPLILRTKKGLSPLLWHRYGLRAPPRDTLTVLVDHGRKEGVARLSGSTSLGSLELRYLVADSVLHVNVTPWRSPIDIVFRPLPMSVPSVQLSCIGRRETVPAPGCMASVASLEEIREATLPSYHYSGSLSGELWIHLPEATYGKKIVVSRAP